MKTININREDAIEQLILSLGALPISSNWNLAAIAEKMANELVMCSDNKIKRAA